jgi:ribosomal protein L33
MKFVFLFILIILLLTQVIYVNTSKPTIVQKTILVEGINKDNQVGVRWNYTHKVNNENKDKLVIGKYCKVEMTNKVITDVFYCSDTNPMSLDNVKE